MQTNGYGLSSLDAGRRSVSRMAEELVGSIAILKIAESRKQESDGFVWLGVDVVFHLDELKPPLPKGDVSDGGPGANTKKRMSLELDDRW